MSSWSEMMQQLHTHAAVAVPAPAATDANGIDNSHRDATSSLSAVSREMDFSGCRVDAAQTDDMSPFSTNFLLSNDEAAIGLPSPATTAATSLLHLPQMNNSVTTTTDNAQTTWQPTTTTNNTTTTTTNPHTGAMGCGAASAETTTAAAAGMEGGVSCTAAFAPATLSRPASTASLSVLHTAIPAVSDTPPAAATTSNNTNVTGTAVDFALHAMDGVDGSTLATPIPSGAMALSAAEEEEEEEAMQVERRPAGALTTVTASADAQPRHHSPSSRSDVFLHRDTAASTSSHGALRLHWCCAAHWRAIGRMERGVQAPALMTQDVYCVPAKMKRPRPDCRSPLHDDAESDGATEGGDNFHHEHATKNHHNHHHPSQQRPPQQEKDSSDVFSSAPLPMPLSPATSFHFGHARRDAVPRPRVAVCALPACLEVDTVPRPCHPPCCEFCGKALEVEWEVAESAAAVSVPSPQPQPMQPMQHALLPASPTRLRRVTGRAAGVISPPPRRSSVRHAVAHPTHNTNSDTSNSSTSTGQHLNTNHDSRHHSRHRRSSSSHASRKHGAPTHSSHTATKAVGVPRVPHPHLSAVVPPLKPHAPQPPLLLSSLNFSNMTSMSNRLPLSSSNSSLSLDRAESVGAGATTAAAGAACGDASSLRDAAMMAAVAMF